MPKTDPVVKSIKHAKALSLKKWHKARKDLEALLRFVSEPCGFCHYYGGCVNIENEKLCLVTSKCMELNEQVNLFLEGSLNYIEDNLIPWIENFQVNGETN